MTPATACHLADLAHGGQLYAGKPYIDAHVTEVVHRVTSDPRGSNEDAAVVAWLHDVLEDTPFRMHHLVAQGLSTRQQAALRAITRELGESYHDYLVRLSADPLAVLVKHHDLQANLAAAATLTSDQERRYEAALAWLAPYRAQADA